jgi:hypothetical protein
MISSLILFLKLFLGKRGVFISRTTTEKLLDDFFRLIRPLKTNYSLVRVGSDSDGGYLIPDDLMGVDACFSPGVSITSDFEMEMANRGIKCFMADYSVEAPSLGHELFYFEKRFLGSENDDVFMTLENWVSRNHPNGKDMILQMDIEGYEYEVILNTTSQILQRFRIIVIEFHDLDQMLNKLGYSLISQTFRKLLKDFEIVHIHPNNIMKAKRAIYKQYEIPSVIEITFLRRDRITTMTRLKEFPHKLDQPNSPDFEEYSLPACWFNH